jgi:putative sigma-54 modulation protein
VQISISVRHGNLSEASQQKLRSKIEKLSRIFDRLASIEVTIDLSSDEAPRVDLNVSAEHKHDFVARETADTLWGAVDAVVHKMEQQLRRYKEKVQGRNRNPEVRRQEPSEAE